MEAPAAEVSTIKCPTCGAENPSAARFCRMDGTPLTTEAGSGAPSDNPAEPPETEPPPEAAPPETSPPREGVPVAEAGAMAAEAGPADSPAPLEGASPAKPADEDHCMKAGEAEDFNWDDIARILVDGRKTDPPGPDAAERLETQAAAAPPEAAPAEEALPAAPPPGTTEETPRPVTVRRWPLAVAPLLILAAAVGAYLLIPSRRNPPGVRDGIADEMRRKGYSGVTVRIDGDWKATLEGEAASREAHADVLALVRKHREIRAVVDAIREAASPPVTVPAGTPVAAPATIEGELNRALRDAGFSGVTAVVGDDLQVTLKGSVATQEDKGKAFDLVKGKSGVGRVRDMIFVVEE